MLLKPFWNCVLFHLKNSTFYVTKLINYFPPEILGEKLEKESDLELRNEAVICYLCSASIDPLVELWRQQLDQDDPTPQGLTHVVEMVLIARLAATVRGRPVQVMISAPENNLNPQSI